MIDIQEDQMQMDQQPLHRKVQIEEKTKAFKLLIIKVTAFIIFLLAISYHSIQYPFTPIQINTSIRQQVKKYNNSQQSKVKATSVFNFGQVIQQKHKQVMGILRSKVEFSCIVIDPIFHKFSFETKMMYFQTYYEIILPSCLNIYHYKWSIDKQNIQSWHQDSFGIQWAIHTVKQYHKILYYRPNVFNILQIIFLSKRIGPMGELNLLDFEQHQCLSLAIKQHRMPYNIKYLSSKNMDKISSFQPFNIVIANQTIFDLLNLKSILSSKLLLYSNAQTLKRKEIFKPFQIFKLILDRKICGKVIFQKVVQGEGFYSISFEQKLIRQQIRSQNDHLNCMIKQLEPMYSEFKQNHKNRVVAKIDSLESFQQSSLCINPNSDRDFSEYIITIYGYKLYDVSLEQVKEWQERRQIVEWVRTHNKAGLNIYYEMNNYFNLLSIISIAILIGPSSLTVVCFQIQCNYIRKQIKKHNITNINIIANTSSNKALETSIIITDNQEIIKKCVSNQYLQKPKASILGFFTSKKKQSLQVLRKIYVNYQIRQVITSKAKVQCIGYQYLHYFWNSQNPNGFYEIRNSKYIVYVFWGGSPSKLDKRKKFLIEQLVTSNVQIKIVNSEGFLYFQVPSTPIHPAYHLLTSTQKSDYFRVYLMHHYGGAYCDVKHIHFDWLPYFQDFEQDENQFAKGYHEINKQDVACQDEGLQPTCEKITSVYDRIIGNGCYMFKKDSQLTRQWFNLVTNNLDKKYEELKRNPPQVPRQFKDHQFKLKNGTTFISKYPFRWAQIANQHLARVQYNFLDHISNNLPYIIMEDYRTMQNLDQN